MALICPTITASSEDDYATQIANVQSFAKRLHIDFMDGKFVETKSIPLDKVWWPKNILTDLHIMGQRPQEYLKTLIELKPSLVVFHYEAEVDHLNFASQLKAEGIKAGVAILQDTPTDLLSPLISFFDQVLVFSGHLGYQGGQADLSMLEKVKQLKQQYPNMQIAWDGGVNDMNIKKIQAAGASILNVGGYIQHSSNPKDAYDKLLSSLS